MPFQVLTLVNGSLEENCYFFGPAGARDGVIIDPGSSPERLRRELDSQGLRPGLILATHGHFDHIGAAENLAEAYGCAVGLSRADEPLLDVLEDSYAFYGLGTTRRPRVGLWLEPSTRLPEAGLGLTVLATPGHTPGSLCFWHAESRCLFSGDTLFAGGVGRSDSESGHRDLIASIRRALLVLPDPDSVRVYPGHGEATTLGEEMRHNPYLR